jgi:hypothetical protein
MSANVPFETFRVLTVGDPYAFFQVSVQPAFWARQGFGEDSEIQKQRRFIQDAITEKIERERQREG